jgi:hypothetical protein
MKGRSRSYAVGGRVPFGEIGAFGADHLPWRACFATGRACSFFQKENREIFQEKQGGD